METVKSLLTFRSQEHLKWFIMSMFVFFGSLYVLSIAHDDVPVFFLFRFCTITYAVVSLFAFVVTEGGKINGDVFSVDCIWFNALMSSVYLAILLAYALVAL
jgi:hypothetical protein